jgi:hypothetical protein
LIVQNSVVLLGTPAVVTVNDPTEPSFIEPGVTVNAYVSTEVSLTVTDALVTTTVPEMDTVRILTVNVSAPSVKLSASGPTLNDPVFVFMANDPETALKSASPPVVTLLIVQNSVVPSATLAVVITNEPDAPSLIEAGVVVNAYVGVNDVSLTVTDELVVLTVPVIDTVRILTVNVWAPSVVASAVGVMVNDPVLLLIENDPDSATKSAATVVTWLIVQNNDVALGTP